MRDYIKPMLLIAPLLLFLGVAYIVPFLGVVSWSVTLPEPGIGNYGRAIADPLILSVFVRTFRICAFVNVFAVIMAYAIALIWVRGTPGQRLLAELCILIPFWISVLTRAFGWVSLLSNRGLINTWLTQLGVISEPLTMVRNEFGVILGMTHFLIPFAVFPIASAMRSLDERPDLDRAGIGFQPGDLDVPAVVCRHADRPGADADGGAAGRVGHHAVFLPDLAVEDERLCRLRHPDRRHPVHHFGQCRHPAADDVDGSARQHRSRHRRDFRAADRPRHISHSRQDGDNGAGDRQEMKNPAGTIHHN